MRRLQEVLHDDGFHADNGYLKAINPKNISFSLINRIPRGCMDRLCEFLATTNIDNIDAMEVTITEDEDFLPKMWRKHGAVDE